MHRSLYKCVDLYEWIFPTRGDSISTITLPGDKVKDLNRRATQIVAELLKWSEDNSAEKPPRILYNKADRTTYKQLDENKGPLNQIHIKIPSGECVDIQELSHVAKDTRPFECHRVYYERNDNEALAEIKRLIRMHSC